MWDPLERLRSEKKAEARTQRLVASSAGVSLLEKGMPAQAAASFTHSVAGLAVQSGKGDAQVVNNLREEGFARDKALPYLMHDTYPAGHLLVSIGSFYCQETPGFVRDLPSSSVGVVGKARVAHIRRRLSRLKFREHIPRY